MWSYSQLSVIFPQFWDFTSCRADRRLFCAAVKETGAFHLWHKKKDQSCAVKNGAFDHSCLVLTIRPDWSQPHLVVASTWPTGWGNNFSPAWIDVGSEISSTLFWGQKPRFSLHSAFFVFQLWAPSWWPTSWYETSWGRSRTPCCWTSRTSPNARMARRTHRTVSARCSFFQPLWDQAGCSGVSAPEPFTMSATTCCFI